MFKNRRVTKSGVVCRLRQASLIISITSSVLWLFSCFIVTMFMIDRSGQSTLVHVRDGGIWLTDNKWDLVLSKVNQGEHFAWRVTSNPFPKLSEKQGYTVIPFHFIFGFSTAAYLLLYFWTSKPKQETGRCTKCGYNLEGTPNKCPECGTIPPMPDLESSN